MILTEGGLGVLGLDLLAPLSTEEEVGRHGVLGCLGVLLGLSLSLLRLFDLGPLCDLLFFLGDLGHVVLSICWSGRLFC